MGGGGLSGALVRGRAGKIKCVKAEEAQSPSHSSPPHTPGNNYSHGVDSRERVLFSSL